VDDLDNFSESKNDLSDYNSAKKIWEANSFQSSSEVLERARAYLKSLPPLVGTGPHVTLILDLNTSQFKGYVGNFDDVFGLEYNDNMSLTETVEFIYPDHNPMLARNFPTYINHILSLSLEERDQVDLSVLYKYKRQGIYNWMSFRAFKYFSDRPENLGYAIFEYTDITKVKNDNSAKYIVYDKRKGYIVNEVFYPVNSHLNSLTPSELAISKLVAQGMSDKELAADLGSAIGTIKQHKKHIFSKLKINKSTELVAIAYEHGLLL